MKKDRTKLIIGILMTLMLFSSFVALWEYSQNKELQQKKKKFVHVYVLTHDVKPNHKLTPRDITLKEFPKDVVSWKVLKQNQILHKYTKTALYKGEPLLASKLQSTPLKIKEKKQKQKKLSKKLLVPLKDTITLPVKMFRNIDKTLTANSYIDIVTVDPQKTKERYENTFKTKYVAICVKVTSFSFNGNITSSLLSTKSYKKKAKELLTQEMADMINLEVTPKNINNLLYLYYKTQPLNAKRFYNDTQDYNGHLWIVRCGDPQNKKLIQEKEKFLLTFKKQVKKVKRVKRPSNEVRIDYEE
jgi:hypothetical protein